MPTEDSLFRPRIESLEHLHSGKVRELYAIDDERMLIVATDRLSAFDVILPTPIPGKGRLLTTLSNFWFGRLGHVIGNHLLDVDLAEVLPDAEERAQVEGRAVVARRLQPLPVEAIVRGYLIGSGLRDYEATGGIGGIPLPDGLRRADRLPEPMFTPSTKASVGDHDENIDLGRMAELAGPEYAERIRAASLRLYAEAAAYAAERGLIIADTKFEFGIAPDGELVLIDELLTPDSSRFWPADGWRPGENPPSFDKQFIRDWLETLDWDKTAPGPEVPDAIARETADKYREAVDRLTGPPDRP
ncbi:phosphoribosylaminoimidazolesuccinocarboxamide synthase [Halofilum ochraceum]|uniref:phosphoribosylaminoimidazolesuccinocarboxamide synthase n=1 Tax=Halofilum ochraceum TaxID=1611323 RepID=UPI0008D9E240|nr:phosphoribosylaminoimidazolesuccinocarboxamide synthase [Halofilum ochraceum]